MVRRHSGGKSKAPSQRFFMKNLTDSGYTDDLANKVWEWYNPPEQQDIGLRWRKQLFKSRA